MNNMCHCCSISGGWFKSIICLKKKAKNDRSNKVKVYSTTSENSNESISPIATRAAICIQTAFRAYMAKKAVEHLKGAVRFNVLIRGNDTQKQASSALSYIHSWSYIQDEIKSRRHHMVTQGRIKQRKFQNQLKLEAKLQELEVDWCGGSDTMEDILLKIHHREEAAVKRERAMAYAFSHQWRANPTQYLGQVYYSIGKEKWGWSWKERWIAARPWEIRTATQQKPCGL